MWIAIIALLLGFIALVWSADRFVAGAAATAANFGVSKIIIGLTVVSVGTSAPEILVALAASLDGAPTLAIGNAIGSNIANIGLVLGVTAIVAPLPFAESVRRTELPWLMGATVLALGCLFNLYLGVLDGLLLVSALVLIMYRMAVAPTNAAALPESIQEDLDDLPRMSTARGIFWLVVGLIVILGAAQVLVKAAVHIATLLGVDELIIGLTIIAVGTSLPELAATVTAAVKGHPDIAIGNVVGSNILNVLAVLAVPALVAPTEIQGAVLWRDYGVMLAMTLLLALFAYGIGSRKIIWEFEGFVLVAAWIGYNVLLYSQA